MPVRPAPARDPEATRRRLIAAAVRLILRQGFAATGVGQICAEAGVTKGAFFHHFAGKEALALAVIRAWGAHGTTLYTAAWADPDADPLDQLHALLDIMAGFTRRPGQPCVCAIGNLAQELSATHPEIRRACAEELGVWTENARRLLAAAKARHRPAAGFDPAEVAWFLNSLWQGSMLVAKTGPGARLITDNLRLARAWLDSLFAPET